MKKPSVSSLMDILNKPALISWANKLGLAGESVGYYSKKKMEVGTKKHSEIEDFLLHGICLEDIENQQKIESIFSNSDILGIEESFESDLYKGRVDIRFVKDGISYIGDFKSKFKRPYLEHYLQLICYKMYFGCDKICIIDLKEFQLHELSLEKEEVYKSIILNLVNIYNLQQQL